jgi:hypothetical protein
MWNWINKENKDIEHEPKAIINRCKIEKNRENKDIR